MIRKLAIFLFVLFLVLLTYLHSQERPLKVVYQKKRIALVIGNAAYKSAPLRNPTNDANDMAAVLKRFGFDLTLLTNANQKTMEMAIRDFGNKLKRGGVGLFYYAGHSIQVKGVNYLIPIGTSLQAEDEIKYEAVDVGRVLSKMESAGNDMNMIILDACRDNPFARSFRSSSRGLARMDAPKGTLIVYSTSPGKTAADGSGRNGIFTKNLLNVIKETNLEITHLLKEVRKRVVNDTSGVQIPWESSSLIGNFYFPSQSKPTIPEVTIEPRYGTLEIYVDISGAKIYQDGELLKETTKKGYAFVIPEILIGTHTIRISHERFKDYETTVNIYEGKLGKLTAKLGPISASTQKKPTVPEKSYIQREWQNWQEKMQLDFNETETVDTRLYYTAEDKMNAWKEFLRQYNENNLYSYDDETLRRAARKRLVYWQNYISTSLRPQNTITRSQIEEQIKKAKRLESIGDKIIFYFSAATLGAVLFLIKEGLIQGETIPKVLIVSTIGLAGVTVVGISMSIRGSKKLKQLEKQKMRSQIGFNMNFAKKHYAISFKFSF